MEDRTELIDSVPPGGVVLSMSHITKIYPNGFVANRDVSLEVRKGEILGLVGENGAGKTTLMKILFGQLPREEGSISLGGQQVKIRDPLDALSYGIGMVHQHFMLVEDLTVAENMVLGAEPGKGGLFDIKEARRLTREVSRKYELPVDPDSLVKDLSVGIKQRVEILKMLLRGARVILLDEPTAVLTPQETKELFRQLVALKEKGFSFVFISHKLGEVKEICDRITILRLGRVTGNAMTRDVSEEDISRMMVGRDVVLNIQKDPSRPSGTVLRVRGLSHVNRYGLYSFRDLNFDVRAGEILGVAGVEGNGQSELAATLTGLERVQTGTVQINGKSIAGLDIGRIRDLGVSMVHEDRMEYGASRDQSISENLIIDRFTQKDYCKGPILQRDKIAGISDRLIEEYAVKCDGREAKMRTLSGGNVQKVVAAREFSSRPRLLIVSHPTRGIDIGSSEMIRQKMIALRDSGTAILLFSADLGEIMTVSDRVMVMHKGRIAAYFGDASSLDENTLGEYMLGIKVMSRQETGEVCHDAAD